MNHFYVGMMWMLELTSCENVTTCVSLCLKRFQKIQTPTHVIKGKTRAKNTTIITEITTTTATSR
jgi:hypothetical protein